MPTVILEAMSRGLAVIATVGAVSELVPDKTGWLIEPSNVKALEEAMIDAIEGSEKTSSEDYKCCTGGSFLVRVSTN